MTVMDESTTVPEEELDAAIERRIAGRERRRSSVVAMNAVEDSDYDSEEEVEVDEAAAEALDGEAARLYAEDPREKEIAALNAVIEHRNRRSRERRSSAVLESALDDSDYDSDEEEVEEAEPGRLAGIVGEEAKE